MTLRELQHLDAHRFSRLGVTKASLPAIATARLKSMASQVLLHRVFASKRAPVAVITPKTSIMNRRLPSSPLFAHFCTNWHVNKATTSNCVREKEQEIARRPKMIKEKMATSVFKGVSGS